MLTPAPINIVLHALTDPTRRATFERIARAGEMTVSDLTRGSGVSQGAISQHLKVLKNARLVMDRPQGRHVHYRAEPQGLAPLAEWMSLYADFWRDRFADLRSLLEETDG